ncbi:imm11 family protein [Pedobacter duraquae]|uniref:Immunity MXAN-0049 protein domain-containing protein n=1 Tax=Pedobacter duraquae TaxID=425511 RepID=A0A4R6IGG5_9SPHI|nr:DUF1629 domain-containing protein [Pedobacter duraquae]TDO20926.1 hypothetical protein CLV32_3562 [Pedobacter duraquae]
MYFKFLDFYKRDVSFVFNEEKSSIDVLALKSGQIVNLTEPLLFEVDKIDSYINEYDVLPTFNMPLVSGTFKKVFDDVEADLQFLDVIIEDANGKRIEDFYLMNILNVLPIMDQERSVYDIKKYGKANVMKIKKLFLISGSLKDHLIVRMQEQKSYIIVTEEFRRRYEGANLKGAQFIEEGDSIYTDI